MSTRTTPVFNGVIDLAQELAPMSRVALLKEQNMRLRDENSKNARLLEADGGELRAYVLRLEDTVERLEQELLDAENEKLAILEDVRVYKRSRETVDRHAGLAFELLDDTLALDHCQMCYQKMKGLDAMYGCMDDECRFQRMHSKCADQHDYECAAASRVAKRLKKGK